MKKACVIVATKGRPKEAYVLLDYLARQTKKADRIIIVGSEQADIEGLEQHALTLTGVVDIHVDNIGSCRQRNAGLDYFEAYLDKSNVNDWLVTFFDDDFRPADDWLQLCAEAMCHDPTLMGISGRVLADGIHGDGYSEAQVKDFLSGTVSPIDNPFSGEVGITIDSLYGCNMALRGRIASQERFDENLPQYGWLEDTDYSARFLRHGHLAFYPKCKGVHKGNSSGRTDGIKFGYSQIANPLYLIDKGTLNKQKGYQLMSKNIASNILRTITMNRRKDYKGRLLGNYKAALDLCKAKCHPSNINQM